jgi:hypothetical protein
MNFSPNTSTGSSGRGRPRGRPPVQPFPYMPNLLSDPSYLTAAMQSTVPSLDVAMTYFKAQMEAQIMQQMLSNSASSFANFSPATLSAFSQLPAMPQFNTTAQQIAKDRPNLSVTAINTAPSTSRPKQVPKKSKEITRPPKPQFPVQLSVPTKAKLKAKVPTPPMRASPIPQTSSNPSQIQKQSPNLPKRQSPVPGAIRKNSPIPSQRSSPIPPIQSSSPIPPISKHSTSQHSSPPINKQSSSQRSSPIPPVRRTSPIPPIRRNSPIPPIRRNSPIPPVRRNSPIPPVRRNSPIPPVRRQSPVPPVRRQSPIPPKKSSPISPIRHIANPAPSTIQSMIPRGPPGLTHVSPTSYTSPPQAHMNPTLERIGREVTVTQTMPKHPRVEAPKAMNLPLNLPASITITPKSHHRAGPHPGRDEISIQQLPAHIPPATITRAEPKVSPPKPDKPKPGNGVEIITLE